MPYLPTAQSWLENSTLLLSARPTTARITTKYTINRNPALTPSSTANPSNPVPSPAPTSATSHPPPKASLVLKTYDPVSGTCLKYRTTKAAEVGRLIAALGTCGRVMAALPEKAELVGNTEGEVNVEVESRDEEKVVKEAGRKVGKGKLGVVLEVEVVAAVEGRRRRGSDEALTLTLAE